ncbi:MAG: beta-hydroxyacyl-ACP dehydratase, partial [Thermoguttaceae bacterium]|nr:beta-hydroxyacyl-ACP dehydratase [Thermoguttaceae bacterium]
IVPGVILCESALQAGAILATQLFREEERGANKVPVVGRMTEVKYKRIVRPGERVEQQITFKERVGVAYFFRAKVVCEGKLAVSFEFAVTTTERPEA